MPLLWDVQQLKPFQLQGGFAPLTPTRGSARGPRWGLCPQTPVIGSRSALAMGLSPPKLKILATSCSPFLALSFPSLQFQSFPSSFFPSPLFFPFSLCSFPPALSSPPISLIPLPCQSVHLSYFPSCIIPIFCSEWGVVSTACCQYCQGCSGAGTRWNAVPANILEPEWRSGKYSWPQVER